MNQQQPPAPNPHCFLIGRDSRGNWVAQDQQHRGGGLFVDRAQAIRFALFENGRQPQAVVLVPEPLELDLGGQGCAGDVGASLR